MGCSLLSGPSQVSATKHASPSSDGYMTKTPVGSGCISQTHTKMHTGNLLSNAVHSADHLASPVGPLNRALIGATDYLLSNVGCSVQ